jgi:malonate transporter and related proteins
MGPGGARTDAVDRRHSIVLPTLATFVCEIATATGRPMQAVGRALHQSLLHPVVRPVLAGAAWSASGATLPCAADTTLSLLAWVTDAGCSGCRRFR